VRFSSNHCFFAVL